MDVADILRALGLSADPPMRELEGLSLEGRAMLCAAVAEAADAGDVPDALLRRAAALDSLPFHDHLDHIDPSGPAALAFESAPWARVQHWEEELIQHPGGLPALDEDGAPADRLAAALTVLARSKSPSALARIEGWLGEATAEQRVAAAVVLGAAGIGVARGQRAVPVWSLPPRRIGPPVDDADDVDAAADVVLGPDASCPACTGCGGPLVSVLSVKRPHLGDLGLRGGALAALTCPSCLADGSVLFLALDREGAVAEVRVEGRAGKVPARAPLVLPAGPDARRLVPAPQHDDVGRPDRTALSRIGGGPTFVGPALAPRSPKSGEPMVFVGQLYLEASEAILYLFYCSEDALLATCAQHYVPSGE